MLRRRAAEARSLSYGIWLISPVNAFDVMAGLDPAMTEAGHASGRTDQAEPV